jgi:hypothetical protein
MRGSFWGRFSCAICPLIFLNTTIGARAQESCANLQQQLAIMRSSGGAGSQWDTWVQQRMQQLGCFGGQQQTIAPRAPSESRYTPPVWSPPPPPPPPPQPPYDLGNNPVIQSAAGAGQFLSRNRPLQEDIPLSSGVVNQPDPVVMQMAKDVPNPFEQSSPPPLAPGNIPAPRTTPRPAPDLSKSIGTIKPPPDSVPGSTTAVSPSQQQQPVSKYDVCVQSSTFGPRAPASCELGDYIYFQNGSSIKIR